MSSREGGYGTPRRKGRRSALATKYKLQSVHIFCVVSHFSCHNCLPGNKWWQRRDFRGILLSLVLSSPVGRRSRYATEFLPNFFRPREGDVADVFSESRFHPRPRVVATEGLSTFSSFLFSIWVKLRYTPSEILCHHVWRCRGRDRKN